MARTRWTNWAAGVMVAAAVAAGAAILDEPKAVVNKELAFGAAPTRVGPQAECGAIRAAYFESHRQVVAADFTAAELGRAARRAIDDEAAQISARDARRSLQRAEKAKSDIERRAKRLECPLPGATELTELIAADGQAEAKASGAGPS